MEHFVRRNFNRAYVQQQADAVRCMDREDTLKYIQRQKSTRIPLVITYHHKFKGIAKTLIDTFNNITSRHVSLKKVFPEPPMIAYRRAANLKDKLVRANHHSRDSSTIKMPYNTKTLIDDQMNHSGVITNQLTKKECNIAGGSSTTRGCIYAAECTKHHLMYVGETGGPLNVRFYGHRSDTKLRPERCELNKHFASNNCDIGTDMRVSVLENVPDTTETYRMYKEDRWVTRLQCNQPTGLNISTHEFGQTYKALFK